MAALFDIFAALVVAFASAMFAHFGVLLPAADSVLPQAQAERVVKRTVPTPAPSDALIAVVRR